MIFRVAAVKQAVFPIVFMLTLFVGICQRSSGFFFVQIQKIPMVITLFIVKQKTVCTMKVFSYYCCPEECHIYPFAGINNS